MLMQQCTFRKGNSYTVAWVDAKKVKNATRVTLKTLDDEWWDVISKGTIKEDNEINKTFKNNHTEKFGNKS